MYNVQGRFIRCFDGACGAAKPPVLLWAKEACGGEVVVELLQDKSGLCEVYRYYNHSQKANYSFTTAHPLAPVVVFLLLHRPIHQQALEEGSQEFPELVAR